MTTIFSKIITGEIPSYKIAETDDFVAFFDIFPLVKGHTLVIPKKEVDYILDMEDTLYQQMFLFAKKVGIAIEEVVPCKKIGIAVLGLEVPHAHIHLVPINQIGDLNFANKKLTLAKEEFESLANQIRSAYNKKN